MITYPRTDARVLSKAVAEENPSNLKGILRIKESCQLSAGDEVIHDFIQKIVNEDLHKASWEKGLGMIANGEIRSDEYMVKLEAYIKKNTQKVLELRSHTNSLSSGSNFKEYKKRHRPVSLNFSKSYVTVR